MSSRTSEEPRRERAACELLEWDTRFFGFRIARATPRQLSPATIAAVDSWSGDNGIRCTYLLALADDPGTVRLAHEHAFRFVDMRLTLAWNVAADERSTSIRGQNSMVRPARPDDVAALEAIARVAHRGSRFYQDGGFPSARCDDLYAMWIRKSCEGEADVVFVVDTDEGPGGYVTCHRGGTDIPATIGLLAVGGHQQGRGVGRALVEAAQGWFRLVGVDQVTVVTQGHNVLAQRTYQSCGFRTEEVGVWFHKWYEQETALCG